MMHDWQLSEIRVGTVLICRATSLRRDAFSGVSTWSVFNTFGGRSTAFTIIELCRADHLNLPEARGWTPSSEYRWFSTDKGFLVVYHYDRCKLVWTS